jgi:hypothetical protein
MTTLSADSLGSVTRYDGKTPCALINFAMRIHIGDDARHYQSDTDWIESGAVRHAPAPWGPLLIKKGER